MSLFRYWTPAVSSAANQYNVNLSGSLGVSGSLTRYDERIFTGSIEPLSVLSKLSAFSPSSSLSPSGLTNKLAYFSPSGAIIPSSILQSITSFVRSLTGSVTLVGLANFVAQKSTSGALSPSGSIGRVVAFVRTLAGNVSPASVLNVLTEKAISLFGNIYPAGTLRKHGQRSLSSEITPVAIQLSKSVYRAVFGAITPTSLLSRISAVARFLTGAIAPAATLTKHSFRSIAGSIVPTSILERHYQVTTYCAHYNDDGFSNLSGSSANFVSDNLYVGATDNRSAFFRFIPDFITSPKSIQSAKLILNPYATRSQQIDVNVYGHKVANSDQFADQSDFNYCLANEKTTNYANAQIASQSTGTPVEINGLASVIEEIVSQDGWVNGNAIQLFVTPNVVDSNFHQYYQLDSGETVSPEDGAALIIAYSISIVQVISGIVAPVGTTIKSIRRSVSSAFTPLGLLVKKSFVGLSGALAPSALLNALKETAEFMQSISGAIAPAGQLAKFANKSIAGAIAPSSQIVRLIGKGIAGAVTPLSMLVKAGAENISGAVAPNGVVNKTITHTLQSSISFTHSLFVYIEVAIEGLIAPIGQLHFGYFVQLQGIVQLVGEVTATTLIPLMWIVESKFKRMFRGKNRKMR